MAKAWGLRRKGQTRRNIHEQRFAGGLNRAPCSGPAVPQGSAGAKTVIMLMIDAIAVANAALTIVILILGP